MRKRSSLCRGLDKANGVASPSRYQAMWLFVMFDLPVRTKAERRRYAQFRKHLLGEGFLSLQYSVYARYFESEEASAGCRRRVAARVPADGRVRLVHITDIQFAKMSVFFGKCIEQPEQPPEQLLLF